MKLVVATSNPGKLRELGSILPDRVQLLPLSAYSLMSPDESGQTFLDNALIKVEHASSATGLPALADDSGLEVDALGCRPGVISARFAGADATDEENNRRLIAELSRFPDAERHAQFVCVVAFRAPDGFTLSGRGTVRGKIVDEPRGDHGFGYDPYFELDDPDAGCLNGRTMAELTLKQKSRVSHRRRALEDLIENARATHQAHHALKLLLAD